MKHRLRVPCFVFAFSCFALAQTGSLVEFEVASVKPNHSDERLNYALRGNRMFGKNMPVKGWIQIAYQVKDFQIVGPSWISDEKFDIEAKAESPSSSNRQMLSMLQTLLADRFRLVFHREMKEAPAYALLIARGGLKMKASKDQTLWSGDFPDGSPDGRPLTGGGPSELAPGLLVGEALPMTILVNLISVHLDGP